MNVGVKLSFISYMPLLCFVSRNVKLHMYLTLFFFKQNGI